MVLDKFASILIGYHSNSWASCSSFAMSYWLV